MFLTEKEILDTPVALDLTCKYFEENAEKIEAFFAANPQRKFTIMGCGSSYMLSKRPRCWALTLRQPQMQSRPATILPILCSGRKPFAAASF